MENSRLHTFKKISGFTLIELVVVIVMYLGSNSRSKVHGPKERCRSS